MRIRIHSNSRVDVLNLKRKAYKKGKDTKPFKGIVKFHGKKRSVKSKRNYIARRKTTKPEWLAGRGATSYPASTSSSCSEKSPKEEITDEDDLDGLNQLSSKKSEKSRGQLSGKTKITRSVIGKCAELENEDEKQNDRNKSENSESDSSSSSSSGSDTSSSCSNYSDISESDSDNGTILIPTSSVTRSSSKLLSLQPLESTIYQAGRDRNRKGSDKENSSPTPRKTSRSTRNLQHTGNHACCSSREFVDVHYKSPVELNSVSETIQPGTGSKNLSFLMQHLADRIRGERVREDLERTAVRPSAHVHFVHSQTKHVGRSQKEIQPPRSHLPLIHRYEHPKQGSNNAPSFDTSLEIPKLNDLDLNRVNHEKDYFPNFENISDFEEIPKTFEDFDMSTFHDFNEFEGRFDLEWELVDELVRDSCMESKSKPKGYHLCKCQDGSRIKQEAIKKIESTLRRFEFGHDSSFATGKFYLKDREKVFNFNTISSHFTTWLSDAAN